MIRRPPRSTHCISSAASDVYKRQGINAEYMGKYINNFWMGEMMMSIINVVDPEIELAISQELGRQQNKIELIASENFVSKAVMAAQGSVLTNKYAEGYPRRRYYGGCEYVDIVEQLAIDRAKELFGAEHANVQPHSGANANTAVYFAFLNPGDTILGMKLAHGGHLSHGSPVNISGKYFKVIPYGVKADDHRIDYEELHELAIKHRPKMLVAGASAYPRVIDFAKIGEIAQEVGAIYMVDMAHIAGLVAVGLHPSPIPYADVVTTTTHKTLRGPRGGMILCKEKHAAAIDKAIFPGLQGGPLMHVIAAKAVALKEAVSDEFKTYQVQVLKNCKVLAEKLTAAGFTLVSGGSDNHLLLVDVRSHNITGKQAEHVLDEIGITVNKNAIPFDPTSPFITSGIRIGTPAATSRGMKEEAMREIGEIIQLVLSKPEDAAVKAKAAEMVKAVCAKHPLYAAEQAGCGKLKKLAGKGISVIWHNMLFNELCCSQITDIDLKCRQILLLIH
eukprot:TRINITY_DN256_c0_g1_i2.p1 TRINITY_DN256_c0_g1~~TRINITY_DN256_c0_g1_i2.p1  ORF type:complete len:504 (+),score=71.90 TRINITY_DN256_c0_g1_i2:147-1658(+)